MNARRFVIPTPPIPTGIQRGYAAAARQINRLGEKDFDPENGRGRNLLVFIAVVFLVVAAFGPERARSEEPPLREIKMTAKKYEYNPEEIRVRQGERVRLRITALDRKHGFRLRAFGIEVELPKGEETVVEFVADKAGKFEFECSVRCGWRHPWMDGKLIVEPAEKKKED